MTEYIDIGANLFSDQFKGREEEITAAAQAAGTDFIITGSSMQSSIAAAEFAKDHKGIYATAGIHPHAARHADKMTIPALEKLLEDENVVAVGECGLDYDRMFSPKDVQQRVFEEHLELAERTGKPLFLHERAASDDFYAQLAAHPDLCKRAVVHCYTGDRKTAERYLSLGCFIGITGWICDDRRNADLLGAVKMIPLDRLMAETDAPYLIPRGIKGLKNPNLPQNISYVAKKIAEVRAVNFNALKQKLLENTRKFFGLPE